ncbi:hypothetical protein LguiB_032388 [Lonicera macranthoides]
MDFHRGEDMKLLRNLSDSIKPSMEILRKYIKMNEKKAESLNIGIVYNTEEMATTPDAQMQMKTD